MSMILRTIDSLLMQIFESEADDMFIKQKPLDTKRAREITDIVVALTFCYILLQDDNADDECEQCQNCEIKHCDRNIDGCWRCKHYNLRFSTEHTPEQYVTENYCKLTKERVKHDFICDRFER